MRTINKKIEPLYVPKDDNVFCIYQGIKRYKMLMLMPWAWEMPDLRILKSLKTKTTDE